MKDKKELIRKLRAMADGGTKSEKATANKIIDSIIEKYKLDISEIDDEEKIVLNLHWKYKYERRLATQIAWKVIGFFSDYVDSLRVVYKTVKRHQEIDRHAIGFECTVSQAAEIEAMYEYYKALYKEDLKYLHSAFLQKHDLFGINNSDLMDNKKDNIDETRLLMMMSGLSDGEYYKQLEYKI